MSAPAAFCIVGVIAAVCGAITFAGFTITRSNEAIAVACVSNGGQWRKPSWKEKVGCIR